MLLSQTPASDIDKVLQEMYGTAPCPPPRIVGVLTEADPWPRPPPSPPPASPPRPAPRPGEPLLHELPVDALRELYKHVGLPCVLKRVCRALRDAGPERMVTLIAQLAASAEMLKWAYRVDCPIEWDAKLAARLAWHNGKEALMWARNEVYRLKWDSTATKNAARNGHLELLTWLLDSNCPHDVFTLVRTAACHGHLHVLRYLNDRYDIMWTKTITQDAARCGQLAVLQWLRQPEEGSSRPPCPWNSLTIAYAAMRDRRAVIEWATANGARMRSSAMVAAAENNNLELLRWMRERNVQMTTRVASGAAYSGNVEILQFLRSGAHPCPWDATTTFIAAKFGHLRVLAWAMDNGCPVNHFAWAAAATFGHVPVARYLHAVGFPLSCPSREDIRNNNSAGRDGLHRFLAWYDRARSPWQRLRNALLLRGIVSYWWSLGRESLSPV